MSTGAFAAQPTFQGCSLVFYEQVAFARDLNLGVPPGRLGAEAKPMADLLNDRGYPAALMAAHEMYRRCAGGLGKPVMRPTGDDDEPFRQCAFTAATRTVILSTIMSGIDEERAVAELPGYPRPMIEVLYRFSRLSFGKAVFESATVGTDCVKRALKP